MFIAAPTRHRLLWLSIFAIAMAQLEATVVAYLRELYYPNGFSFPLVIIRDRVAVFEIGREASTIVMLVAVARLAVRDPWRRFASFLLCFGLWDIFYYAWLWVMLRWPESLLTWDILFLIPLPWVGPVLSAGAIAAIMVAAALGIEALRDAGRPIEVGAWGWLITILGALGLLGVFMSDARAVLAGGAPGPFPWLPYLIFLSPPTGVALRTALRSSRGAPSEPSAS
jgi:hypothetical protein